MAKFSVSEVIVQDSWFSKLKGETLMVSNVIGQDS